MTIVLPGKCKLPPGYEWGSGGEGGLYTLIRTKCQSWIYVDATLGPGCEHPVFGLVPKNQAQIDASIRSTFKQMKAMRLMQGEFSTTGKCYAPYLH